MAGSGAKWAYAFWYGFCWLGSLGRVWPTDKGANDGATERGCVVVGVAGAGASRDAGGGAGAVVLARCRADAVGAVMALTEQGVWRRRVRVNSDGTGLRWHDVYVLPASGDGDYWSAVTDVPCPLASCDGVVRWAESGAVPGWRRCDGCQREYLAVGSASAPALRRQVRR